MRRKEFMQATSLVIGTALLPTKSSVANSSTDKLLKKGIGFGMIQENLSILDKFKLVKDLGFDGVELNSPSQLAMKELLEARDITGIEIPSTVNIDHWTKPLNSEDAAVRQLIIQSISDSIVQTKALGGDTVLVVPAVVNEKMPYEVAYDRSLEAIRALIPIVERTGVKIGLENVWNNFIMSPIEAKQFMDEINHPLIGWYFDIGNVLRYGWPEHWIETLNTRIIKLHAKGFSRTKMHDEGLYKGFQVELTQGDVNWSTVMKALKENNYNGEWITLEVAGGDRNHLQKLSSQLDLIINS